MGDDENKKKEDEKKKDVNKKNPGQEDGGAEKQHQKLLPQRRMRLLQLLPRGRDLQRDRLESQQPRQLLRL